MSFREWFQTQQLKAPQDGPAALTEHEEDIMRRIAAKVVEWKMSVPAIIFLESVKPLNYIGAQAMIFFEPFIQTIFNFKDYDTFRLMMEKRENTERLLLKIEELDAEAVDAEKRARAQRRRARGHRWWWPFGGSGAESTSPPDVNSPN